MSHTACAHLRNWDLEAEDRRTRPKITEGGEKGELGSPWRLVSWAWRLLPASLDSTWCHPVIPCQLPMPADTYANRMCCQPRLSAQLMCTRNVTLKGVAIKSMLSPRLDDKCKHPSTSSMLSSNYRYTANYEA